MPKKNALTIEDEIKLSADELALVNAYFDCNMNQTRAYLKQHPRTSYDSARTQASTIFAKPNIRAEIRRRLDEQAMTSAEVLFRLGQMARASHLHFIRVDDNGFVYFDFSDPDAIRYLHLIKSIKTKRQRKVVGRGEDAEEWEGEWVEVELHDSQKALELIGKYHKMFAEKTEDPADTQPAAISIPAELIAPDFLASLRAIQSGKYSEFLEEGGRGSTKSSFISLAIIYLIVNNPEYHALITRQVKDTMRDSVYAQLVWAIDQLGLTDKFKTNVSPLEITYLPTGQKIFFRGADEPGKIKSIKPSFGYIAILWFEELDQFNGPETVRNIEQSAIRGGDKAFIFKSFNPPRSIANWANKYAKIPKANQWHHKSTYLTVPTEWLGKAWLDEAEHLKKVNPKAYEHEYLGIANGVGGMVFDNVVLRKITDEEIKEFDNILDGVDWGFYPDPYAWDRTHYDAARLKIYIFDEYHVFKASNRQTADHLMREKGVQKNDLITADSAEPKSVADYREYGLNCRGAEKGKESVRYSYKWLQSLVEIVIDPERAPETAIEFTEAEFPRDKDGNIINAYPQENDHHIAAVRYATNLIWRQRGQ